MAETEHKVRTEGMHGYCSCGWNTLSEHDKVVAGLVSAGQYLLSSFRGAFDDMDAKVDHEDGPCPVCDFRDAIARVTSGHPAQISGSAKP